jgi:hypothetical protein
MLLKELVQTSTAGGCAIRAQAPQRPVLLCWCGPGSQPVPRQDSFDEIDLVLGFAILAIWQGNNWACCVACFPGGLNTGAWLAGCNTVDLQDQLKGAVTLISGPTAALLKLSSDLCALLWSDTTGMLLGESLLHENHESLHGQATLILQVQKHR